MTRQQRNGDRHSSIGDAVRDDVTAELFAFPHIDFFRETAEGTGVELTGNRSATPCPPAVVATGRHGHPVVS
ncbi:hypothetical protein ACGFIG_19460 [Micromonospora sp. NPDC049048]|uniref:hypothetical protein n=1 Tax=Micromonospora sp. NPDC049048 TaxID=3364263 RepID=UPI00371C51D1